MRFGNFYTSGSYSFRKFIESEFCCLEITKILISQTNGSYVEGVHWKRGQLVGTGGCSTCYCAWDVNQGQLMCVKQVYYRMFSRMKVKTI